MINVSDKSKTIAAEGGTVSFDIKAYASIPNGTKGKPIEWKFEYSGASWLQFNTQAGVDGGQNWTTLIGGGFNTIKLTNPADGADTTVLFKAGANTTGAERSTTLVFTAKLYAGRTITANVTITQPAQQ